MSRSVRDLRELVNVSRLSYRDDEEVDDLYPESVQDFDSIPLEVSQPSLPKRRNKDLAPLASKEKPVSPPLSSGSSGRGSPLPPIGSTHSLSSNNSPSSSGRNSPASHLHDGERLRVVSAHKKDIKPSKPNFDKILLYMDSTVIGDWLTKANDSIKQLTSWLHSSDNFVQFAHFWLSEMPRSKQRELMDMEFSVLMEEIYFAFGAGLKEGSITRDDIDAFSRAVLWEYPEKFHCSETRDFFLNILLCLCSGRKSNYRALLSDVQCSTLTKQFVQLILATRAFAIVSIFSGVLEFYKTMFQRSAYTNSVGNSIASKSLVTIATEFAFQAVQKELPDVLGYLMKNYSLQHQTMKDSAGKSVIFTAVLSGNEKMLGYLLKVNSICKGYMHTYINITLFSFRFQGSIIILISPNNKINPSPVFDVDLIIRTEPRMNRVKQNSKCKQFNPLEPIFIISGFIRSWDPGRYCCLCTLIDEVESHSRQMKFLRR